VTWHMKMIFQFLVRYWQTFHRYHILQLWRFSHVSRSYFALFFKINIVYTNPRNVPRGIIFGEQVGQRMGPTFLIQRSGSTISSKVRASGKKGGSTKPNWKIVPTGTWGKALTQKSVTSHRRFLKNERTDNSAFHHGIPHIAFGESRLCPVTLWGFSLPHTRQLFLVTVQHRWNVVSWDAKRDGTQLSNAARMRVEDDLDQAENMGELPH